MEMPQGIQVMTWRDNIGTQPYTKGKRFHQTNTTLGQHFDCHEENEDDGSYWKWLQWEK